MHLFIFSIEIMYYLHKTTSAVSCVKSNASQWEATLRDDIGFATVYRRIYRRKFLTLSNQTSRYIRECIRIFFWCSRKAVFHDCGVSWVSSLFYLYPRLTLMLRTLCGSDCISSWVHLFTLPFGGFEMADCSPGNMYFLCISSETIIGLWYRKQFEVFSFVIISEYACFTY